ncbi:MAG TPA: PP2C family protein-serine/threonine phosphatase [Alloacidobacterium sp.]|nr:PP2C family protein-serine/threonine phosphatase [Alloacidobacterium sp.]
MSGETVLPEMDARWSVSENRRNRNFSSTPLQPLEIRLQNELDSLRQEKLDLYSQLFEAGQIQRKLSGARELRHGCLQFASEVFAARFLSGDFTMFLQHGSRVLAAHGDIAGKGIPAGMWFTNLAGLLQSYGYPDSDPAEIASEVNRHLCYLRPVAPFATVFLAQVDCESGTLTYCNAGHFPPVLLRGDGQVELLESGGPLLGAIESAKFSSAELILGPGDTLLAYSDGVLECRNAAGEEFGMERLAETLRLTRQPSPRATLMVLLAALQDFANGGPICDDVSLTVIQRNTQPLTLSS